jgi:hypothetical protein
MKTLYVILRISTGELMFGRAYDTEGRAKSALKNRVWKRGRSDYVVAKIEAYPVITAFLTSDGSWTHASEVSV